VRLIEHPERYKVGTRVLFLKSRHKDGISDERHLTRVTHSVVAFDAALGELAALSADGERIYGSAGARDLSKAVRLFKERQLAADYDADPGAFYRNLEDRWASALMAPTSQLDKLWLFDCDAPDEAAVVTADLARIGIRGEALYQYASKSGTHIIAEPFDRTLISSRAAAHIHANPLMLWGY